MAQEIERKFLVKNEDFKKESFKSTDIKQGFLSTVPERTVRIRVVDYKGYITIKGIGNKTGTSRYEWEKEISIKDASELLLICESGIIHKTRYHVKSKLHIFEVDVFYGENEGLIVAEVELSEEDEDFVKPNWLGEEVTGRLNYFNSMLKKNPFKNWK